MLTQYILKMPHVVYSGEGALDHIKEIAGTCAGKAVVSVSYTHLLHRRTARSGFTEEGPAI